MKSAIKVNTLPTGCKPFPTNANGNHVHGDWEFFYKGGKADDSNKIIRHGATSIDMYPGAVLTEHGALFFY